MFKILDKMVNQLQELGYKDNTKVKKYNKDNVDKVVILTKEAVDIIAGIVDNKTEEQLYRTLVLQLFRIVDLGRPTVRFDLSFKEYEYLVLWSNKNIKV